MSKAATSKNLENYMCLQYRSSNQSIFVTVVLHKIKSAMHIKTYLKLYSIS